MIMIEDNKIRTLKLKAIELQMIEDSLIYNTYAVTEFYGKTFKDLLAKIREAKYGKKRKRN